jgi:hypothetical protein
MLKNIVERGRPQITTWYMHIASWIPEATNTRARCVIIIAFPLQQWLHEHATLYAHCLSCYVLLYVRILWLLYCI